MGPDRSELVVRVRERRQRLGLTQQQLAERAGISRQALVAIEVGKLTPSVAVALRLARALDCAVEELFSLPEPARLAATLAASGAPVPPVPFRVRLARIGEELVAWPAVGESGEAEGIAHEQRGERLLVEPLVDPAALERGLVLAGCDPALATLAAYLRRWYRDLRVIWVPVGSRAALRALARGEAHIAGTHLWDPASGDFNIPAVRRELAGRGVAVVTLSRWVEGLGLAPANPKGIRGLGDLARPDVTLVNREPGSGSRTVLDVLLAREGLEPAQLRGYQRELRSHRAVAEAVASGLADAGPLVSPVARAHGLAFLPLLEERYDLVVPAELLDWPPVRDLLELLASRPVRRELAASGYAVEESGTLIARLS
ncbi:MAG: substrate-binding domain-containing protein [Thermomicrobium sp.]|nr:helix-turn-helix domain-containing protein [Thermomicrobium sp.]MDW8060840.1 substrate-binding domain-containing protein [Thermomicrobium sp.]